jgi:paraquat-inducible protein B
VDEKGLRARLESVSFVTGQYLVALSLNPRLPSRSYKTRPGDPIRVPAIAATRDRVEEMLESLDLQALVGNATDTLDAIRELAESGAVRAVVDNLNLVLEDTRRMLTTVERELQPLTGHAERTLNEYGTLATRLQARIDPLADGLERASTDLASLARSLDARVGPLTDATTGALAEASRAMRAISTLAGEGSSTRLELDRLLAEATRAARSLRSLSDYLERHPEALLHGKR